MGKTCPIDTSIVHFLLLISKISVHLILRYWFICRFQRGSSWGCPCPQTGPWCAAVALVCCLDKHYTNAQLFRHLQVIFIWSIISFTCMLVAWPQSCFNNKQHGCKLSSSGLLFAPSRDCVMGMLNVRGLTLVWAALAPSNPAALCSVCGRLIESLFGVASMAYLGAAP